MNDLAYRTMKNNEHAAERMDLDRLIEQITVDSFGNDEQLWAFRQVIEDNIPVPCDGYVIGQPVSILAFEYNGNGRRGLTAQCRREDGSQYVVAAAEVRLGERSPGARYLAAYRKWLGLEPLPRKVPVIRHQRQHKVAPMDIDLTMPVELVVLSVKERTARCRLSAGERVITLRASRLWEVVPAEIVVVRPNKQWNYAGHPYLSGDIESVRLDAAALGLTPLHLEDQGLWKPEEEYWGEADEPIEDWAKPIIERGPRPACRMEQVLPGAQSDDIDSDPICESNDLKDAGDREGAEKLLMELCQADLRCLDAHAHLGNLDFDYSAKDAIRHFEVGVRIGELSLGADFTGLLPWGYIDNRPFLRCLHGFGLCQWQLERFEEALRTFERMLWLNPTDNQGARFLLQAVHAKEMWKNDSMRNPALTERPSNSTG